MRQFIRTYEHEGGIKDIWTYDLDKSQNGPISVETIYPKGYKHPLVKDDYELPLTQRKWINPANGKEVGYTRAKNLGLI